MIELRGPVRDFIARHLDSVESVELLLLLFRSPETFWTADAAAKQLAIRSDAAQKKLSGLATARLLSEASGTRAFRYTPADDEMHQVVEALAEAYANQRISVVNTIDSTRRQEPRTLKA